MTQDFDRHRIADFGQKLAHLEGILGAYLPRIVFDSDVQQRQIDCDKFVFSRLRNGKRMAANWELARFVELFDLARFGFDYRLFLLPFDAFSDSLRRAGVGSYGATAAHHLREALRARVDPRARISIRCGRVLGIGGIGEEPEPGLTTLTPLDRVTLHLPPGPVAGHLLLLHDHPAGRAMACLMPSTYAPDGKVTTQGLVLPQLRSDHSSFPVGGDPGYRCLYAVRSRIDLAQLIGLDGADSGVPDVTTGQVAVLVDLMTNAAATDGDLLHVAFGEYLLK